MRRFWGLALVAACAAAVGTTARGAGTAATPLQASVTSKGQLTLADVTGRVVTRLRAGTYVFHVQDASRKQDFHLLSRTTRLNRRSGLRFVGALRWRLTLRKGRYVYFSDAKPAVRYSFRVT